MTTSEINLKIRKNFAEMLKRERLRLGLTQTEFTKALGFSIYTLLSKYENCEILNIRMSTFEKFSEATGIPFDEVIKEACCGIEFLNLHKDRKHKIFELMEQEDLNNLINECIVSGEAGQTMRNIKYSIQISILFNRLPIVRKHQIHESILKELFYSSSSEEEKSKYLEECKIIYKKWAISMNNHPQLPDLDASAGVDLGIKAPQLPDLEAGVI